MKIAVVGSGISGLLCAYRLRARHDVALYEARPRLGGHTATVDVEIDGRTLPVDTGFIVFNERNYPGLCALFGELGVESRPTSMSFSYRDDVLDFEYGGAGGLRGLLAQRRNAFRPSLWRMVAGIRRFGREAPIAARGRYVDATLGEYLAAARYPRAFVERYLVPMGAAIWSAPPARLPDFPLRTFVEFFDNHGMLQPWRAPLWRYVVGGSRRYVDRIAAALGDRVRCATPVRGLRRVSDGVLVETDGGGERYDEVVVATHSDQALRMLRTPSANERRVLGAIPYQRNDVVLHTDATMLPRRRAAWSSWNAHDAGDGTGRVAVTYLMNMLQALPTETPVNVTLNATDRIDPEAILERFTYAHPVYDHASFAARGQWAAISGVDRIHYCGAYWRYGFHEDGVRSATRVCRAIGVTA